MQSDMHAVHLTRWLAVRRWLWRGAAATAILASIASLASSAAAAGESPATARLATSDPQLRSAAALVVDQDSGAVLYAKNPSTVQPIASITKLMTAIVTLDAQLDMDEILEVDAADRAATQGQSRLWPGTRLTRRQALQVALMASENRAAQLLGRTYPGGVAALVAAMNARAIALGMHDSRFVDPTGLSQDNRSSPQDLVRLVDAAYEQPQIRAASTSSEMTLQAGHRTLKYVNTNRLTRRADWRIGLQKTGYIAAAGRCLVMQAEIGKRRVVMVFLDSYGKYSRLGDAQRMRSWLETQAAQAARGAQGSNQPDPRPTVVRGSAAAFRSAGA